MNDFIFDEAVDTLELSDDLGLEVVKSLGFDSVDDLELSTDELSFDSDDDLSLEGDESEGLSDALLIQNVIGVTETLAPYATMVARVLAATAPTKVANEKDILDTLEALQKSLEKNGFKCKADMRNVAEECLRKLCS